MHYLVATDSARTSEAACDYLRKRVTDADEVLVLAVAEDDGSFDHETALATGSKGLPAPTVETAVRRGSPAKHVRALADERGVDEVVIGQRRNSARAGLGGTASTILVEANVPVVVLPTA